MIKDSEEYKTYRSKLSTNGISAEESDKLKKEMGKFRDNNPDIFRKMSEKKWVGSLTDPQ